MITAAESIGTTINNRSDSLQNTKVIFALWEAKKINYLKELKDYFKASIISSVTGGYPEYYRSLRTPHSTNTEWLLSRPEGSGMAEAVIKAYFDKIYQPENKPLINRLFSARIATTYTAYRPEVEWLMPKESPIAAILSDLRDLMKENGEDEEDEYGALRPTIHAFRTTLNFIIEASFLLLDGYPFGCVSTDSEGGIRIEWFLTKGEIRLVIPASKEEEPYIYYEFDEKYGVDRQTSASKLARWINQLNNL